MPLGIPWEPSKDQPCAPVVDFYWRHRELRGLTIEMLTCGESREVIDHWQNHRTAHTLVEVQGSWVMRQTHSAAFPMGCSFKPT